MLDLVTLQSLIPQYLFTGARLSGLLMTMPVIGTQLVPHRIKIILLVALSILIAPLVPQAQIEPFSLAGMMVLALQLMIGVVIGLTLQIIFQTFVVCGQLIAQQMGLGFASMMDPQNGISAPAVGQMYIMMVTLMFLGVNGHLMVIEALVASFQTIPIGMHFLTMPDGAQLIFWGGWIFTVALQIALPAITALFLVNIGFGVMTKSAPQINIFSIGFPATMLAGIAIIGLTLSLVIPGFELMFERTFALIYEMLGGLS